VHDGDQALLTFSAVVVPGDFANGDFSDTEEGALSIDATGTGDTHLDVTFDAPIFAGDHLTYNGTAPGVCDDQTVVMT